MTQSQLPAHLQKYHAPDVSAALSQNFGSAMPPHVSIEGGRFKLIDASNNEIPVPTFDPQIDASNNEIPVPTFDPQIGVYLDAVIIDVNEHMSRMYYIRDYDQSACPICVEIAERKVNYPTDEEERRYSRNRNRHWR